MLTIATIQSITARKRGREAAKSTGPVKKLIALPTPTRQSSMSASAPGTQDSPSTAITSSLDAKMTASTGTVAIMVVRSSVTTAARSFAGVA